MRDHFQSLQFLLIDSEQIPLRDSFEIQYRKNKAFKFEVNKLIRMLEQLKEIARKFRITRKISKIRFKKRIDE